jgi:hypothetical protein
MEAPDPIFALPLLPAPPEEAPVTPYGRFSDLFRLLDSIGPLTHDQRVQLNGCIGGLVDLVKLMLPSPGATDANPSQPAARPSH